MTDDIHAHDVTEHIHAPLHEVPQRLAEGWRLAPGWHLAGHHLRYSICMYRPVDESGPSEEGR